MMNEKKITELLEKAEPVRIELPRARAALRRRLLNQPTPRRGRLTAGSPARAVLLGAAAAMAAAVGLALLLQPRTLSAGELLRGMEAVYAADPSSEKVHYTRSLVDYAGESAFEVETWRQHFGARVRFLHRDALSGEILGHAIIDNGRRFDLGTDTIRVRRQVMRRPADASDAGTEVPVRAARINMILVGPAENSDQPEGERTMLAFVLTELFDRDDFARRTPRDLVDGLLETPDIEHTGTEIDLRTGRELHVLQTQRTPGLPPLKVEFPEKYLDQVGRFAARRVSEAVAAQTGEGPEALADGLDFGTEVVVRTLEVSRTIKVIPGSLRVHSVANVLLEDGQEVLRIRKEFLSDVYLDYSPTLFDPAVYGLEERESQHRRSP